MPSPIAHSLAGLAIAKRSRMQTSQMLFFYVVCIFHANAPDLDFIPGIIIGSPNRFHHNQSHSLFFGLVFCLVTALLFKYLLKRRYGPTFIVFFLCYLSHLVFDFLAEDTSMLQGIPLLWPFSSEYFYSPIRIFSNIVHGSKNAGFIDFILTIMSFHNVKAVLLEIFWAAILYGIITAYAKIPSIYRKRGK